MYMCMHMRMQGVRDGWRAHAYVPMNMCMHMHMQGVRDEWRAQLAGAEAEVSRLGLAKAEQSHVDRALTCGVVSRVTLTVNSGLWVGFWRLELWS